MDSERLPHRRGSLFIIRNIMGAGQEGIQRKEGTYDQLLFRIQNSIDNTFNDHHLHSLCLAHGRYGTDQD